MGVIILSKKFSNFKGATILYRISNEKKKKEKRKFVDAITTAHLEMTTQFMSRGTQTCSPPLTPFDRLIHPR